MSSLYKKRKSKAVHFDPYNKRENESNTGFDETSEQIEGRNTVSEAIKAGIPINKIFVAKDNIDSSLKHIISLAKESGIVISEVDRRKLDALSFTHVHQGIIATTSQVPYAAIEDILNNAQSKKEPALVVVCDSIYDPHNLGAIIRTCEAAGAHGVILPKRRSAALSAIVAKSSGGAVYHTPVARVTNLSQTIKELKSAGLWIYGTSSNGNVDMWNSDFTIPSAFVIGSEGSGISRLVQDNCDYMLSIPMFGNISSLNASVSAGVILYEAIRQRKNT